MTTPSSLSGIAVARYFDAGTCVGTRRLYCCGYRDTDGASHSAYWPHTAYFCPHCGEIWGREVLSHQFNYAPIPNTPWVLETRRCRKHGDGMFLTGKLLEDCSTELLQREFSILLNQYDKELQS